MMCAHMSFLLALVASLVLVRVANWTVNGRAGSSQAVPVRYL